MSGYRLTRFARVDLAEIWIYIARDNVEPADRVEQSIYEAFDFVAAHPRLGHPRLILGAKAMRFWVVPQYRNYSVVYRPDTKPIDTANVAEERIRRISRVGREPIPRFQA